MDKNETIIAITSMVASQKQTALTGSYILSSMVVFNDPSYVIIGVIGAVVSTMSHHYDIQKEKALSLIDDTPFYKTTSLEVVKAFLIGFLFTIAFFLFMNQVGESIIKHYIGIEIISKLMPSFYMVLTLYLSTLSIGIYDKVSAKIRL